MSQFSFSSVQDSFSSLANLYLESEKIKASQPAAQNVSDYNALTGARDDVTQRVNVQPMAPTSMNVTGQNAGRLNVGSVGISKTALYVTGGVLGGVVLLKALKVI